MHIAHNEQFFEMHIANFKTFKHVISLKKEGKKIAF